MGSIRDFVRFALREHLQSVYNDYDAAQDPVMRRMRLMSEEDVRIHFPDFVKRVHELLAEEDTPDLLRDVQWFFMKMGYSKNTPVAVLPTGDSRVVYWDEPTEGLRTSDDIELLDALKAYADRKPGFEPKL